MPAKVRDLTVDAIVEDGQEQFGISSPRSLEALGLNGITVEELQYRPLESYLEDRGVTEELAVMRFQHIEGRRRELIRLLKHEYRAVCLAGNKQQAKHEAGSIVSQPSMQEQSMDKQAKELEAMNKQLEAMKNKQKEEIVQQLTNDFRNAKMAEIRAEKEAAQAAKDAEIKRQKQQAAAEWEAIKLERENQKKEEERLAEIERKRLAEQHFRQEKALAEKAARDEKRRKKEAQEKERERMEKAAEQKRQTDAIFAEQQRKADDRKRLMDEKDRVRREAMDKQRQELQEENRRKRVETEERMQAAVEQQRELLLKQQREIDEKNRLAEEKRQAFEARRNAELAQARADAAAKAEHIRRTIEQNNEREEAKKGVYKKKEDDANKRLADLAKWKEEEEKRRQVERDEAELERQRKLEKALADEEARKLALINKFEEDAHKMDKVNAERNRQAMIKQELERLKKQDKINAVERLKRKEAFEREQALQKLEEQNRRLAEIDHQKYLMQQEKIRYRKEQDLMMKALTACVEKFAKTKVWKPPAGLDIELDIKAIKEQAEASVLRSREPSQNSVGTIGQVPVSGKIPPKTAPIAHVIGGGISKKKAPLSARGRMEERRVESYVPQPAALGVRPASAHGDSAAGGATPNEKEKVSVIAETIVSPAPLQAQAERGERQQGHTGHSSRPFEVDEAPYQTDQLRPVSTGQRLTTRTNKRGGAAPAKKGGWADKIGPRRPSTVGIGMAEKLAENAYRPAKKSRKKGQTQAQMIPSKGAAMQMLDGLRRQQNEQLLAILEEEQAKEAEREFRMAEIFQQKDKQRLERLFTQERAQASLRIIDLTARHEKMLAQTMIQLGLC